MLHKGIANPSPHVNKEPWTFDTYRWASLVVCGKTLVKNGEPKTDNIEKFINFPTMGQPEKPQFRTVFGPVWCNWYTEFMCDSLGMLGATRRIGAIRENNLALHTSLIHNQRSFCRKHRGVFRAFRNHIWSYTQSRWVDPNRGRQTWARAPHVKRKERVAEMNRQMAYGDLLPRIQTVKYNCKPNELLPQKKKLRGVGDLTCAGASVGAYIIDPVKEAMERDFIIRGKVRYRFCKAPVLKRLKEEFERLINCENEVEFLCFSDDSCIAVRCMDGVILFNCDVSCCDGSNFAPVFEIVKDVLSAHETDKEIVDEILSQCQRPCVIRNPANWHEKIFMRLREGEFALYSGSVLTTTVNNIANLLIATSLSTMNFSTMTKDQVASSIVSGAAQAGYLVKAQMCEHVEDLQFLKYSPLYTKEGDIMPVLNIGTWLRGDGTCSGHMPGSSRIPWKRRCELYRSGVIESRVHSGEHVIAAAYRTHITKATSGRERRVKERVQLSWLERQAGKFTQKPVLTMSLARRYRLQEFEVLELAQMIKHYGVGYKISHPTIERIIAKDYGDAPKRPWS